MLAALGGLLFTAYIGAPSLGIGNQFLLTSVAAVVVGGTVLTGGVGSVVATIGGTIFITELNSFTNVIQHHDRHADGPSGARSSPRACCSIALIARLRARAQRAGSGWIES